MHRVTRRIGCGLMALALATGTLGVWASPAGAAVPQFSCTAAPTENICVSITPTANGSHYVIHVGVDIRMSRDRAERFLDRRCCAFYVGMYASDPGDSDFLFFVQDVVHTAVGDGVLAGDFEVVVPRDRLNEDLGLPNPFNTTDEVYARVTLQEGNQLFHYYSDVFSQEY